jgi:ABC-2 type transport system ATP-binding protein
LVTGTPAELRRQVGAEAVVEVALERVDDSLLARVRGIPGVREARLTGRGLQVLAGSRDGILPRLVEQVLPFGLQDLAVHEPTLETVFIQLTGRALRE